MTDVPKKETKREGFVFKRQRRLSAFSLQLRGNSEKNLPRSPNPKAAPDQNLTRGQARGGTRSFETHLLNCGRV